MKRSVIPSMMLVAALATGCKTPVVFTTHTSLGLDVSGTAQMPNKVSFSYNRFEGAIVPRKTNGEAHSVYGGMDADVNFFGDHTIKQTFATGKAAMLATGADTTGVAYTSQDPSQAALVFVTATTYGLHLTAGEQQMSPNLLMGYRRTEAAMIPVPDPAQEVRSVYADILINSSSEANAISTNFSSLRGVRIKQSFATGRAADSLAAKSPEVRAKLSEAAGLSDAARKIYDGMNDDLNTVMAAVVINNKIDAARLQELITEDDKLIEGTEDWVSRFGGKPAADFKNELAGFSNYLVPQLAKKIKATNPH